MRKRAIKNPSIYYMLKQRLEFRTENLKNIFANGEKIHKASIAYIRLATVMK